MSGYSLTSPEMLHGFGIIESPDSVPLRLSGCEVAGAVLRPLPLQRRDRAVESWWDLSPRHPGTDSTWVQALSRPGSAALPLYLRNPTRNYWFEHLPAANVLYFQYNRSQDAPDERTAAFGERLLAVLDSVRPTALVVDLRHNTGGNLTLGADLMRTLEARTRGMQRFLITGRATFSAGITHAAIWRERGGVTVVGEPVADVLDFWAEGGNVVLPQSGFKAHFANGAHSYSPAPCPPGQHCYDLASPALDPDLPVAPTWDDYVSGRDPALDAIIRRLSR